MLPQAAIEKSTTDENPKPYEKLLKGKTEIRIGTMNVQTLRKDEKIPELVASSENTSQDVICIQEHRFIHDDSPTKEHNIGSWRLITCSAWKNNANAGVGGIGILLNAKAYKALVTVEMITNRIMVATFHGNPQTTIICCYSPTNVIDENDVEDFYEVLESLTRRIPKHNMLIVGGDFNAHLGQQKLVPPTDKPKWLKNERLFAGKRSYKLKHNFLERSWSTLDPRRPKWKSSTAGLPFNQS